MNSKLLKLFKQFSLSLSLSLSLWGSSTQIAGPEDNYLHDVFHPQPHLVGHGATRRSCPVTSRGSWHHLHRAMSSTDMCCFHQLCARFLQLRARVLAVMEHSMARLSSSASSSSSVMPSSAEVHVC